MDANIAQAVLAMMVGFATLLYLNKSCEQSFKPIQEMCFTDLSVPDPRRPSFVAVGVPVLDHFMCFVTSFFTSVLANDAARFFMSELSALFFAVMVFVAVESQKSNAKGMVGQYFIGCILSVVIGVSVYFPMFWLASYLWANKGNSAMAAIPTAKVLAIGVGQLVHWTVFLVAFALNLERSATEVALFVANWIPALVCVFWVAVPSSTGRDGASKAAGRLAVQILYAFTCGLCATQQLLILANLVLSGVRSRDVLAIVSNASVDLQPAHFIFVDLLVLFLSCVWLAWADAGTSGVLWLLLLHVPLGPGGAFAAFALRREWLLATANLKNE